MFKTLHGRDDLEQVRRTLLSIESMPKGHSKETQVLVDAGDKGLFRIKDIRYNQTDRSVHIAIDTGEPVGFPDYSPDNEFLPPIIGDDEINKLNL